MVQRWMVMGMAEYINREAVRNELYDADAITMRGVAILNNFPSADVVGVVRCKDCKYSEWDCDCGLYLCRHHGCDWNDGEHFCSYGERRDGE